MVWWWYEDDLTAVTVDVTFDEDADEVSGVNQVYDLDDDDGGGAGVVAGVAVRGGTEVMGRGVDGRWRTDDEGVEEEATPLPCSEASGINGGNCRKCVIV